LLTVKFVARKRSLHKYAWLKFAGRHLETCFIVLKFQSWIFEYTTRFDKAR